MSDAPPAPAAPSAGERVVAWSDPREMARAGASMAGLDYLRSMAEGRLPPPPAILLLGIQLGVAELGRVTMTLPPGAHLHDPFGAVHGGMIATLLDSVMGCAVHATLPVGQGYTTLEIKVNHLRPALAATGPLIGTGQVVHAGPQMAAAEGQARDAAGRLYATASTTCLVFSQKAPA
ncbi:MAG: PaaI family thioesterase [Acetobacteraceae bacterium]